LRPDIHIERQLVTTQDATREIMQMNQSRAVF
jgi:hypothetical protein